MEEILSYNKHFVAEKKYEKFITSKYPDKKLAILSCMDTRLTELLPAALGLKNGDAKLIKNAGGTILNPFDSAIRSLLVAIYELGVEEIMVIAHTNCGACHMNGEKMKELMKARGIKEETLETLRHSGIDLDYWLEGFHDTEESVIKTTQCIANHPLIPKEIKIYGYIIDSTTGELNRIV